MKNCKDCKKGSKRKAPYPGPRCYTHHKQVKRERKTYSHARYIEETYSITAEQYQRLYEHQDRKCYICKRATGARKKLSVDHDHSCCSGKISCGQCVRGLLCQKCNRDVLGHLRDDAEALLRAVEYLSNPPAKELFKERI